MYPNKTNPLKQKQIHPGTCIDQCHFTVHTTCMSFPCLEDKWYTLQPGKCILLHFDPNQSSYLISSYSHVQTQCKSRTINSQAELTERPLISNCVTLGVFWSSFPGLGSPRHLIEPISLHCCEDWLCLDSPWSLAPEALRNYVPIIIPNHIF